MAQNTPRNPTASELFFTNSEFQVVICRKCEHAVRRDNIITHLTGTNHRVPRTVARYIESCVQQWDHIEDQPNISHWPTQIDSPIPRLTVFDDGLLCLRCERYICRTMQSLRVHWQRVHEWSPSTHEGRPKPSETARIQAEIKTSCQSVLCQRIFKHGSGSQFIAIRQPDPQRAEPVPPMDAIQQLVQRVRAFQAQQARSQQTIIQAGEIDEATPWLNRTGWVRYLQGISSALLVQSMERPDEDAEGPEGAAWAIWQAMERLAIVSQQITRASGFLVRIEAARTQKADSPYEPLLAYMKEAEIKDHIEPWQRILMFFART
jgi:hypothetical protein